MPNDMSPVATDLEFNLTNFLEGRTRAWGIFEDRFGRVRQRFIVEMNGYWSDRMFRLHEKFIYGDGREETRTWQVRPGSNDTFTATCPDCVGQATGVAEAGEINMSYVFRLDLKGRKLHVRFADRLIRIDSRRAVNRAVMSKWGIRLGELSLFFERSNADWPTAERLAV